MSHLDRAKKGELDMVSKADTSSQKRIKKLSRRAQIRLRKTCLMPQRTHVPTRMEIRAVVNALPIMVRVYKLDRSYVTLPVNTHTTIDVLDFLVVGTEVDRELGKYFHAVGLIAPVESHLLEVR